ncbi:hypothetical protein ACYBSK_33100 [Streptomyces sp. BYX5S]
MADEQDKWLNRDAAERLLRGESPAVSGDAARRADRLAAALHALADVPAGPGGELPGEDAALKAFRDAGAVTAVNASVNAAAASSASVSGRRGPRWGRPARFGLVAAVAACMVGGVAVAAGTGVLPSPFRDADAPAPAATVSAAASPDRPLSSPSASVTENGEISPGKSPSPPSPSSSNGGSSGRGDAPHDRDQNGSRDGGGPAERQPGLGQNAGGKGAEALKRAVVDGCRKYRGGELSTEEKRRLDSAAKAADVNDLGRFCDRVLFRAGDSVGSGASRTEGSGGSGGSADADVSTFSDGRSGSDDDDDGRGDRDRGDGDRGNSYTTYGRYDSHGGRDGRDRGEGDGRREAGAGHRGDRGGAAADGPRSPRSKR